MTESFLYQDEGVENVAKDTDPKSNSLGSYLNRIRCVTLGRSFNFSHFSFPLCTLGMGKDNTF